MGELTPREKREALERRPSNKTAVKVIAVAGHAGAAWFGLRALHSAYAAGTLAEAAGPLVVAFLGAAIAREVHADEGVLEVAECLGAHRLASPGPQPAHLGHEVAHSREFGGFLAGLLIGAAGLALAAMTGGLAAPLLIGAGGFVGEAVAGAGAKMAEITGRITAGSPNVRFEGQPVARVFDGVLCFKDGGGVPIMEGSRTIFVNSMPLARVGHKTACGAVIQQGCGTIRADNTSVTFGQPDSDLSVFEQAIMSGIEVEAFRSALRANDATPPDPETVARTGELTEPGINRRGEHPYRNPDNMQTVRPGKPLDVNSLDRNKKYLWVVDPDGNILIAPEDQPGYGRDLKHGDLTPGPDGKSRGPARSGGEIKYNPDTGHWEMNNDSSYTFARKDGQYLDGDNLNAAHDLLTQSGTDTSNIDTVNSHGSDATGR